MAKCFSLDRAATGLITLVAFVVMFQNCGSRFAVDKTGLANLKSTLPPDPDPTEPPTPTPPPQNLAPTLTDMNGSWPAGQKIDNCMTNPAANFCVIYNNPIIANNGPFTPALTSSNSTPAIEDRIISYGLNIPKTGQLQNRFFKMTPINGISPEPDAQGNWKYRIANDNGHRLSQAHTFYWLNRQRTLFTERTGRFFLSNQTTKVVAYSTSENAVNNAYWDGAALTLGYRNTSSGKSDLGLDAGVALHEAGHGNLQFASQIRRVTPLCSSPIGCAGALHEGIGDIHALVVLGRGPLGEYFVNNLSGLRSAEAFKASGKTALSMFAIRKGEIHDMGEVYASIWYEVWIKAKQAGKERDVETVFTDHMTALNDSSTFVSAFNVISSMAAQKSLTYLIADFRAQYQRVKISLPP